MRYTTLIFFITMLESILNALLPVFILIGIGYLFQKTQKQEPRTQHILGSLGIIAENTWSSILNMYALKLALPALIFSSLISIHVSSLPSMTFVVYTTLSLLTVLGLVYWLTKKLHMPDEIANAYIFGGFFGNTAYIGFAYLISLFVNSGATLSLILAIHLIIAFTVGIMILEKSTHHHISLSGILIKTAKNPLLISVFLGLLLIVANIDIPVVLAKAIAMIGNSSSPVVLIALGSFIAREWHHDGTMAHAMSISLIKVIAMPLIFLAIAFAIKGEEAITLSILQAGMPVALANFALAETYAINKTMMANAIIVSTLLSIVTLPLLTWMLLSITQ